MTMAKIYSFKIKKPNGSIIDTNERWGIVCKDLPFKLLGPTKEWPTHSWADQHGDDELILKSPLLEAYEMTIEFAYKGEYGTGAPIVYEFLKYISGIDNTGTHFSFYDEYTGIGRQNVRYLDTDPDIFHKYDGQQEVITFSVKVKITDPYTELNENLQAKN